MIFTPKSKIALQGVAICLSPKAAPASSLPPGGCQGLCCWGCELPDKQGFGAGLNA